jgi:penicillin-insensitive murein endopeptidase
MRRWARPAIVVVALVAVALVVVPWLRVALDDHAPSRSLGRLGAGRLEHGHVFAPWGAGYVTYSFVGASLGTQYANGAVRDALLETFAARARAGAARYALGETAARKGGAFHGHRTHQNGLSADVFMPVRDDSGARATLPTWPWDKAGYGWEFDARGVASGYRIDFDELAAFLVELDSRARTHDLSIERVIIAPELVPLLIAGERGARLGSLAARLTRRPVWIRHDEHVHVDFAVVR